MTPCPRFGKWIGGCRFEGRYDFRREGMNINASGDAFVSYSGPSLETRTYVRDVCGRCGKTVDREEEVKK